MMDELIFAALMAVIYINGTAIVLFPIIGIVWTLVNQVRRNSKS